MGNIVYDFAFIGSFQYQDPSQHQHQRDLANRGKGTIVRHLYSVLEPDRVYSSVV